MSRVYGIATRKGGQGKSTTVATLARLCALAGARVLVVDLAQPGTCSASLRDIWPTTEHGSFSGVLLGLRNTPASALPAPSDVAEALSATELPVHLTAQPSWSGGRVWVLPWDELLADAAAFLHSELVLSGVLHCLAQDFDVALIDFPAEGGPLLTNALAATQRVIIPLVAETPALEGLESMLRLMARARESGYDISLAGILLTQCDPKNKRAAEIVQTLMHADDVEGEPLGRKLYPFAVRACEFYEQAFRYGQPVWDRSSIPAHWAPYVLLAERILRDAGLPISADARKDAAILPPDTPILDVSALILDNADVRLEDFELAHGA